MAASGCTPRSSDQHRRAERGAGASKGWATSAHPRGITREGAACCGAVGEAEGTENCTEGADQLLLRRASELGRPKRKTGCTGKSSVKSRCEFRMGDTCATSCAVTCMHKRTWQECNCNYACTDAHDCTSTCTRAEVQFSSCTIMIVCSTAANVETSEPERYPHPWRPRTPGGPSQPGEARNQALCKSISESACFAVQSAAVASTLSMPRLSAFLWCHHVLGYRTQHR